MTALLADLEAPQASGIRCPRCGAVFPWHTADCVSPRISDTHDCPERTQK